MGLQGVELLGAYTGNLLELVDGGERAVLCAVVEDALGQDWAYSGEGVQLGEVGCVEVDGGIGRGGWRRGGGAWSGGGAGWGGDADEDLFAIGDWAGEVEGGEVHAGERATGEREYVGDARAGGSSDEAWVADLAGDVYDHHAGGRLAGARTLGSAGRGLAGTRGGLARTGRRLRNAW
jgi:hypothetical protein